jgi:mono/diheme cytochrome c family protein
VNSKTLRQFILLPLILMAASSCRDKHDNIFVSSKESHALSNEAQIDVKRELRSLVGTFDEPLLPASAEDGIAARAEHERLLQGQAVYQARCVQCHGLTGDGNGSAAYAMYPKPRDYRKGIFKFTSTPYGSKPARSDLVRTVKFGIRGTSMPDFKFLPVNEIEAVIDYVLYLSQRGQLEEQMVSIADFEGTVTKELVEQEGIVNVVTERWKEAEGQQIVPFSSQPVFTAEHVRRGKEAFLTKGCSKCHGDDGRGQTPDNLAGNLKDSWGNVTRAADLTSGMLHGGPRPLDIYRRIYSGINGTPMPGFGNAFQSEPETLWDLVAYVMYVSGRRRSGDSPPPGKISPYLPVVDAPTQSE